MTAVQAQTNSKLLNDLNNLEKDLNLNKKEISEYKSWNNDLRIINTQWLNSPYKSAKLDDRFTIRFGTPSDTVWWDKETIEGIKNILEQDRKSKEDQEDKETKEEQKK